MLELDWLASQVLQTLASELGLLPVNCYRDVAEPELEVSLNRLFSMHKSEVRDSVKEKTIEKVKISCVTRALTFLQAD